MAQLFKQSLVLACTLALAACGGGDSNYIVPGTGTGTGTGTTTTTVNSLELKASSLEVGSSGETPVVISAIVKDANNNPLKTPTVQFAVDSNATIEPDEGNGNASVKVAKLTPGDQTLRTLKVTAKAENKTATINVAVTGTKLQIEGASTLIANVPTHYKIKLVDSDGKRIAGQEVVINSTAKNYIEPLSGSNFVTNNEGEVDIQLTAANGGTDTITASALNASTQYPIIISNQEFSLTSPNSEINVDTDETISLVWKENGVAQANRTINLTATRGTIITNKVTTDAKGEASFKIRSSNAGGTVITATDAQSDLSTRLVREFVATAPKYLTIQAAKQTIVPKESVEITAIVRDVNNNLVKNQKVSFSVSDYIDGGLSNSSATTDSLGRATVVYTAGDITSAKDGVVITATHATIGTITHTIKLTVGNRALRIVLGEDEKVGESGIFYKKTFGVIVTDSAGNGVKDKVVNFKVHPVEYYKGAYLPCSETSDSKYWLQIITKNCQNEDGNYNGNLDSESKEGNEDFNSNGRLDPSYASQVTSSATTDSTGSASTDILFPQSQAGWSKVKLVASVQNDGTEFQEETEFVLPVLAPDLVCDVPNPPNRISPYGIADSCSDPK